MIQHKSKQLITYCKAFKQVMWAVDQQYDIKYNIVSVCEQVLITHTHLLINANCILTMLSVYCLDVTLRPVFVLIINIKCYWRPKVRVELYLYKKTLRIKTALWMYMFVMAGGKDRLVYVCVCIRIRLNFSLLLKLVVSAELTGEIMWSWVSVTHPRNTTVFN